jgi:hypothetical protein
MAYPVPSPVQPAPVPQESQLIQQLSTPIFQARGWLKFLGVLSIISGVVGALSIVGILYAWLPIWMGVLLFQAGSSIESAGNLGDKFAFLRSMGGLKTYFVIQGVVTLIGIVLSLTMLLLGIVFVFSLGGLSLISLQNIFNNMPKIY